MIWTQLFGKCHFVFFWRLVLFAQLIQKLIIYLKCFCRVAAVLYLLIVYIAL